MLLQSKEHDKLIRSAARRLKGHDRRLFIAEVTIELCDGNARLSESLFGWGRETANKGMLELGEGVLLERVAGGGRPRFEDRNPQLAVDIRAIVEPKTQTDPELKTTRRYTNLSAGEVRKALSPPQQCSSSTSWVWFAFAGAPCPRHTFIIQA